MNDNTPDVDAPVDFDAALHEFLIDSTVTSAIMRARIRDGQLTDEQMQAAAVAAMELSEFIAALSGLDR
jgi:hypothetical protein